MSCTPPADNREDDNKVRCSLVNRSRLEARRKDRQTDREIQRQTERQPDLNECEKEARFVERFIRMILEGKLSKPFLDLTIHTVHDMQQTRKT
jgi:hypothetical protein